MTAGAIYRPAVSTTVTSSRTLNWRRRYDRQLAATDLIAPVWAVGGTQLKLLSLGDAEVSTRERSRLNDICCWTVSAALVTVWMILHPTFDTCDYRVTGSGSWDYRRIFELNTAYVRRHRDCGAPTARRSGTRLSAHHHLSGGSRDAPQPLTLAEGSSPSLAPAGGSHGDCCRHEQTMAIIAREVVEDQAGPSE